MPGPAKQYPARLDLRLTREDKDALLSLAKQEGRPAADIVRELVQRHIRARRRQLSRD